MEDGKVSAAIHHPPSTILHPRSPATPNPPLRLMDWIKRNLMFVIGAVVALGLMGLAGYYNYAGWSRNVAEREKLNGAYEELKRLSTLPQHPGDKKVDNIKLAQEQEREAGIFLGKLERHLARIPSLPEGTNVAGKDFSSALQQTIVELQRDATNHSVILPPKYKFSFEAQAGRVTFAAGSLDRLATQLGEVRVICGLLNAAKINFLDGIRRERVSADDAAGTATDYLDRVSTTNELAVVTPYEVTFRCFTPELGAVLAGFANTPYGLIVKALNEEPAPYTPSAEPVAAAVTYAQPQPQVRPMYGEEGGGAADAFAARYGRRATMPTAQPVMAAPVAAAQPVKTGPQTFLKEKQIKVTLLIHVVKPLSRK